MSKPISFGLSSRNKPTSNTTTLPISKHGKPKPISFSTTSANPRKSFNTAQFKSRSTALGGDSDDEDEAPPKHEELAGFSSTGAILSKPVQQKAERVIENSGNGDWRRRGKNLLPHEVQAAQNGEVVVVEKDEVSKSYGLQFAEKGTGVAKEHINGDTDMQDSSSSVSKPRIDMTEDERALAALLDHGTGKSKSTATIDVQANDDWQRNEADDFRADVAMRPESATLDDYAAMPVEEFGMAMLRGMGKKRRANGDIIDLNNNKKTDEDKKRRERKQEGFLGIGAKPVKGLEGVELGAWGKADMRKNARGEGFFMPVMLEDKTTGERITEEEFERRKKGARNNTNKKEEDDWRDRRDRNLEKSARDRDGQEREHTNGSSKKRDRDEEKSSRSRRDRNGDRDDREYDSSRSRRERSRSRDRRRRDDEYNDDDTRDRERRRDHRPREKHRDDDRYDSTSSRKSEHRVRDRDRDRDVDRDKDRDRDRDDRRHRDRR